jgi:1-acyl-sn-glycerol-3-phosphate acyltransferase
MAFSRYTVPFHTLLLRRLMRPLFRGIFHLLSQVVITGRENVPKNGAYLIAINHVSLYEAPFMLAFWPEQPPEAAGAVDIWSRPGQAALARLYGGIPVHRGLVDRRLIDTMVAVLRSGRPLLIAPEGGRSHRPGMRRALPGLAHVIDQVSVPVVPVGVVGTTGDFLKRALRGERPKLEMRIGKPVCLPPISGKGEERRAARQRNVDLVMAHIAALLPAEYQGVYADAALSAAQAAQ